MIRFVIAAYPTDTTDSPDILTAKWVEISTPGGPLLLRATKETTYLSMQEGGMLFRPTSWGIELVHQKDLLRTVSPGTAETDSDPIGSENVGKGKIADHFFGNNSG